MQSAPVAGTWTVDVEDYFHVSAFAEAVSPDSWGDYEQRVVRNTEELLTLADTHHVRGTFFVLGWVADRFPELVRRISAAGHEIGCHSYQHQLIYDLGPVRFREDLRRGLDTLQQILSEPISLHRAPSFSVTRRSLWALEIMVEEGITLDSSIYPVRHDRYGIPGSPRTPYRVRTPSGELTEFPGLTADLGPFTLPVGGGGYLRIFPWLLTKTLLSRCVRRGELLNIYLHPWEADPQQPRIPASRLSTFRHYRNLDQTVPRLRRMLQQYSLGTMSECLTDTVLPEYVVDEDASACFRLVTAATAPSPEAATSKEAVHG